MDNGWVHGMVSDRMSMRGSEVIMMDGWKDE